MKAEAEPKSNGATKRDPCLMLQNVKMVIWAILSLRHSASARLVLGSTKPLHVIVSALIIAVLVVALLMGLADLAAHFL